MKVIVVKRLPLQMDDLLESGRVKRRIIKRTTKGQNINTKKDNNLEPRRLNCCCYSSLGLWG